jgi:hypothetical protein
MSNEPSCIRKEKTRKKFFCKLLTNKSTAHSKDLYLGLACLNVGPLTAVSARQEGPATGQLDQGFPWFYSVLEQMLSWNQNFKLHCMALTQL